MIRLILSWLYKPTEGILQLKEHLLKYPGKWVKEDHDYSYNGMSLWVANGWESMSIKGNCELRMIERAYLWPYVRMSINMNSDIVKKNKFNTSYNTDTKLEEEK